MSRNKAGGFFRERSSILRITRDPTSRRVPMKLNENATGTLDEIGDKEHTITSEYRIFGAPGTGKTTNLSRQVTRAVEKHGADAVLVTSFSRAAAAELAGRDLPISSNKIGTLHS